MANSPKQTTAGILLAVAAVFGIVSIFVTWGTLESGLDYGKPLDCYTHIDACFTSPPGMDAELAAILSATGALLLVVAVAWLLLASVLVFTNGPARSTNALGADAAAFIAFLLFVIGLGMLADALPLALGMWMGVGMVAAAFAAPILLRAPTAPPRPAPGIVENRAAPRVMRATGPPTKGPYAPEPEPAPPAPTGPRRVKCPKCGAAVAVAPGQRPFCTKCGYGTPPTAKAPAR